MGRMISAITRSKGKALYQAGEVKLDQVDQFSGFITATVQGYHVTYDNMGLLDDCDCAFFSGQKKYCEHIAALEILLREQGIRPLSNQDRSSKDQGQKIQASQTFLAGVEGLLLDPIGEKDQLRLMVTLLNQDSLPYFIYQGNGLVCEASIYSQRMSRSYQIQSMSQLLTALAQQTPYALGRHHKIRLTLDQFDGASQIALSWLLKLVDLPMSLDNPQASLSHDLLDGRYFHVPYVWFDDLLTCFSGLVDFEQQLSGDTYPYHEAQALSGQSPVFSFEVVERGQYVELQCASRPFLSLYEGYLLFSEGHYYHLSRAQRDLLAQLDTYEAVFPFMFDLADKDRLALLLKHLSSMGQVHAPAHLRIPTIQAQFSFGCHQNQLTLDLGFDYDGQLLDNQMDLEDANFVRNQVQEARVFALISQSGFEGQFNYVKPLPKGEDLYQFFTQVLPRFQKMGLVSLSDELASLRLMGAPTIGLTKIERLLEISFQVPEVSSDELQDLLSSLSQSAAYYQTKKGQLVFLDDRYDDLRQVMQVVPELTLDEAGHAQMAIYRAYQLANLIKEQDRSQDFKVFYQQLQHPEALKLKRSDKLTADLRDYQVFGVQWMTNLAQHGMGGILADDMGLGKTLQTISFLVLNLQVDQRALIIAPASLLYNWQKEWQQFTKDIEVVVVEGSKAIRDRLLANRTSQIMITSYQSYLKDQASYQEMGLTYLILDEAQTVKNFNSKTHKALRLLAVDHVFALSGTPIENRADEIWAIFQLIMPGLFGTRQAFTKMPPSEIAKYMRPFMLRRKKSDVLLELPATIEKNLYQTLSAEQAHYYLAQVQAIESRLAQTGFNQAKFEILSGLTRLRQICDSPALFVEDYQGPSSKLSALEDLLVQIKLNGHRPLIFSQFTSFFELLAPRLDSLGLSSFCLTGKTLPKARQQMVDAFNKGERDAFMISLKAGGVGLNLTGADVVILVDLWWNPAVEEQAISRAHRMGQRAQVEVIRLITRGTIEEKIQDIQSQKRDLVQTVIDGQGTSEQLTEAEIRALLSLNLP